MTQKQWERVLGTWPSYFSNVNYRDSRPVETGVSYNAIRGANAGAAWPADSDVDADSFMGRLRARTGKAFELPTESQWEYAGRAGATTALNSGYNLTNTFDDARMAEKDGREPAYYTDAAFTQVYKTGQVPEPYLKAAANGCRLPTEAQWEYAARGGVSSKRFPWGGNIISHGQANYYGQDWSNYDLSGDGYHDTYETGEQPYTNPVGAFESGKNAWGLYDMAGNVWEWCWDWHPCWEGSNRVLRGGSWSGSANSCRVGRRHNRGPASVGNRVGFRAVCP